MRTLALLTLLSMSIHCWSQDSTRAKPAVVDQYCELVATGILFSNRVTISVDYGQEKSIWRDNRLKEDNGKFKKFNTVVDALNYMGKQGWIFVSVFQTGATATVPGDNHYIFRRSFAASELE